MSDTASVTKTRKQPVRDGGRDVRLSASAIEIVCAEASAAAQGSGLNIKLTPAQAMEWFANGLADGTLSIVASA